MTAESGPVGPEEVRPCRCSDCRDVADRFTEHDLQNLQAPPRGVCPYRGDADVMHECEHAPWRCRCANALDVVTRPAGGED